MIFTSIDLMNGKAVQLIQGKKKVLELDNPLELAEKFSKLGPINVIDLDAAFGNGENIELVKKLCKVAKCRVGGGIRSLEKAKILLKAGAEKIIIGTKATKEFLSGLPREKLIVAIDSKKGKVVNKGWKEATEKTPFDIVEELQDYCSEFLYTYVDKEGMMQGTDFDTIKKLKKRTSNKITAAGGISSIAEIKKLEKLGVSSVLGMALYTGKIKFEDLFEIQEV